MLLVRCILTVRNPYKFTRLFTVSQLIVRLSRLEWLVARSEVETYYYTVYVILSFCLWAK